MGNQHEVRQMKPFFVQWGAAIPIKPGQSKALLGTVTDLQDYRMRVEHSDGTFEIQNLDYENVHIERAGDFLCIQSGAKMWCGYQAFLTALSALAGFLDDALIYIADELEFVDQLVIGQGALQVTRVHSGSGCSLDDWPETRLPPPTGSGT
jgi:hypothetical protein